MAKHKIGRLRTMTVPVERPVWSPEEAEPVPPGFGAAPTRGSVSARYAAARARVPSIARAALADAARTAPLATRDRVVMTPVVFTIEGRRLSVLVSVDDLPGGRELHVSLSRPDSQGKPTRGVWWEDLVSVRACCWPDEVEVRQVLPGAEGEEWVNIGEVFHLYGPVLQVGPDFDRAEPA